MFTAKANDAGQTMIFVAQLPSGLHCHKLGRCVRSLIHSPAALHTESLMIWCVDIVYGVSLRTCLNLQLQEGPSAIPLAAFFGGCRLARFICSGKRYLATIASGARCSAIVVSSTTNTSSLSCVAGTNIALAGLVTELLWGSLPISLQICFF